MKYNLTTLLAIIQQAEYDQSIFKKWLKVKRSKEDWQHVNQAVPQNWTAKLRLIRSISSWLAPILGAPRAVSLAAQISAWPQLVLANWIIWRSAQRLRSLQSQGLTVIAIAGSYGKTSVKHALYHQLSTKHYCLMTPESINTPLGIANIIKRLTKKHTIFITELGEQKTGDLTKLIKFIQPDTVIVTPIGYAHSEHFSSEKQLWKIFNELSDNNRPVLYLIDDRNRDRFDPKGEAIWYGSEGDADFKVKVTHLSLDGARGKITTPSGSFDIETNLLGEHQAVNALPGFILLGIDHDADLAIRSLNYQPATPRRLQLQRNQNGTIVVDNSYNTNPGSWRESLKQIKSLPLGEVVVITAGFVEMDQNSTDEEHEKLAQDLIEHTSGVVVLKTSANNVLRQKLALAASKKSSFHYAETYTQSDALDIISRGAWKLKTLWLEGGYRELYQ